MRHTSNYGLNMPEGTDLYNVEDFNQNAEIIDEALSSHTTDNNNPHNVTKDQIGLENVENKSSETIRSELTSSNVTTALGYTPMVIDGSNAASEVVFSGAFTVGSRTADGVVGTNSVAEGNNVQASGIYSHAEGDNTIAGGLYGAHAEGGHTTVWGNSAHAEGSHTSASNHAAHAEGYMTNASEDYCHAEGNSTQASGQSSHSEGSNTIASGGGSHAEGGYTVASGTRSHSEGYGFNATYKITASGDGAHAEGYATNNGGVLASGLGSHAEGRNTKAAGIASHAEGDSTKTGNQGDHAEGCYTQATGSQGAHAEGWSTRAIGYHSHAEGIGTEASGDASHAEGDSTIASGGHSHAEGNGRLYLSSVLIASGKGSHAEGSIGSLGVSIEARGEGSHAEGYSNGGAILASGNGSHAEGINTTASGEGSHAGGYYGESSRNYQFVQGGGQSKFNDGFQNNGNAAFGFQPDVTLYSIDTAITNGQCGCGGGISNTATVTIDLEPVGMYTLYCSSYDSNGDVYGAVVGMVTATGNASAPIWLELNQTAQDAAQIDMLSNNQISIQNTQTFTQFHLIRIM